MMKQDGTLLFILISVTLIWAGISVLRHKDIKIGVGRGMGNFGKVQITRDSIRYVLGVSFLCGGIVAGIAPILALFNLDGALFSAFGIIISVIGLNLSLIFQFAVFIGELLGKK